MIDQIMKIFYLRKKNKFPLLKDWQYEEWMTNLPKRLTLLPLTYIAIPGSHDSFTYSINYKSKVSPDAEEVIKQLISIFGKLATYIIANWAKAQGLNTFDQLRCGIRYFDIRLAINEEDDNNIYACHSLFGNKIEKELVLIKAFLDLHSKEVVLLDFNHFYNFRQRHHRKLLNYLITIFGDKLIIFSSQVPSLDEIWSTPNRVFIFYHCENIHKQYLWPGYVIPSPWGNTDKLKNLITFLTWHFERHRCPDYFYVTQGILTPTKKDYFKYMFSSLKLIMADKATPAVTKWLEDKCIGEGKINCSIVDFAENFNYVATVMSINSKLNKRIKEFHETNSKISLKAT